MGNAAQLIANVQKVLLQDWDPIGIRDVREAQDEYDAYASPIADMIAARASVSVLSSYLLKIETEAMGLAGNRARALSVAETLLRMPCA